MNANQTTITPSRKDTRRRRHETNRKERKRKARLRRRGAAQIRDELLQEDPHCWFCGLELSPGIATFDHLVPICLGGETSRSNGVLACANCNETKSDLPAELLVCRIQRGAGIVRLWHVPGIQLVPTFVEAPLK